MVGALARSRLRWVEKELRQVGLAISIAGTSRTKLFQLAHLAEPTYESLVGSRPEVKEARDDLRIRIHNVRRASIGQAPASKAVYALADAIQDVMKLVAKGKADVPVAFDLPPMALVNEWGYAEDEVRTVVRKLRQAMVDFTDAGLRQLLYGVFTLDPTETEHKFVRYYRQDDSIYIDPDRWEERRMADVYGVFAERLWWWTFKTAQRETWPSVEAFVEAFATALGGGSLDGDRLARLRSTVGVFADGWQM
jgi:hypothetical protein